MGLESAAVVLVTKSSLLNKSKKLYYSPSLLCSPSSRCLSPTAAETAWQEPGKESLRGSPPAALSVWSVPMGSTAMRQVNKQSLVDTVKGLVRFRAQGSAKSLEGLG